MPPNTVDVTPVSPDVESNINNNKPTDTSPVQRNDSNYGLKLLKSSLNLLAHLLIGLTVAIGILFSFREGLPLNATYLHIVLCVIGYQLLMAEAMLSLSSENGWTTRFKFVDKRRAHWILQILGSGIAIAGSVIVINAKSVNWNTLHGQYALVALVFTVASLINGFTSLYAYEFKRFIPANLSKITHICFGTVAFITANISYCYGLDKSWFKAWTTDSLTYTFIAFVAIMTLIVIVDPLLSFYTKTKRIFKKE